MAQVSGDSACRAGAGSEGGKQEKNRLAPLASDDEFSLSGAYRQLKSGKGEREREKTNAGRN